MRHQILNIFIINIQLKSYVPSVLKYYNKMFLNVLHEKLGLSVRCWIKVPMVLDYGNISVKVGPPSLAIFCSRLVMGLE